MRALRILLETVLQDLRYGARTLIRNAGVTVVTIFALALGIGTNTTVFTAYKAFFLRGVDARAPEEIVNIALVRGSGATDAEFSYQDYEAYRDSLRSFSGLIAARNAQVTLTNVGGASSPANPAAQSFQTTLGMRNSTVSDAEIAHVLLVSENYFDVLGVRAVQGRAFDANPSVLISENYWQRRLGGDPTILGKTIRLNDVAVTVVGITPRDFVGTFIAAPAFWVPAGIVPTLFAGDEVLGNRETPQYRIFGRLAPGVNMTQAQAEITTVTGRLHDDQRAASPTALVWPGSPFPLPLSQTFGIVPVVFLVMAAAGVVLIVACANVGSLQLAHARSRETEVRTRMSLGASSSRITRQLLTESLLTGLCAGGFALFVSWMLLKAAVVLIVDELPVEFGAIVFDVSPDPGIFAFVTAVSLIAGMLAGLTPAIDSSRTALSSAIRGATGSVRSRRMQDVLVGAQVALSLALMVAASTSIRSAINSLTIDAGYETERVFSLDLRFPQSSQYNAENKLVLVQDLRRRIAAQPGVVAVTSARPPSISIVRTAMSPERARRSLLHYSYVEANYFEALGIPLVLGRGFDPRPDQLERAVIVSESAAQELWPGQNPIGRSVQLGPIDEQLRPPSELIAGGPAYQVIGIAGDTRGARSDGSDSRRFYLPLTDDRLAGYPLLIRTQSNDLGQAMRGVQPVLASVDSRIVASLLSLDDMIRRSQPFVVSTLTAFVSSAIGAIGLVLALMGIYGTISYIVVLRTREVGIRIAIGAQKRDVLGLIMRESARPVVAGLMVGVLLAAGVSYLLRGFAYGIAGIDVISVSGMAGLFLAVALVACFPPARRAMRVDPIVALRSE